MVRRIVCLDRERDVNAGLSRLQRHLKDTLRELHRQRVAGGVDGGERRLQRGGTASYASAEGEVGSGDGKIRGVLDRKVDVNLVVGKGAAAGRLVNVDEDVAQMALGESWGRGQGIICQGVVVESERG